MTNPRCHDYTNRRDGLFLVEYVTKNNYNEYYRLFGQNPREMESGQALLLSLVGD